MIDNDKLWLDFDDAFHAARSATLNELLTLKEDILNDRKSTALGRIERLIQQWFMVR